MKTAEYRTRDKSTWKAGPWHDEPDKMQFPDEATGLPCLIVRGPSGALCGYVGVPEAHPLFGEDYGLPDVEVHWGLTYADRCQPHGDDEARGICHVPDEGEPDHVWWFGFDCAHSGDYTPSTSAMEIRHACFAQGPFEEYRTIAYVKSEVRGLARQLAALAGAAP